MLIKKRFAAVCDIPEPIVRLYQARQWEVLASIFIKAAENDSANYWDKYKAHVQRIESEFKRLSGREALATNKKYWRRKIAYYIHTLTSDVLITDLQKVFKTYRPNSIIYFLHNSNGKVPRWEQLYRERLEALYQIEKHAYMEVTEIISKALMFSVDPQWVVDARSRYRVLTSMLDSKTGNDYIDAKRESDRIVHNLRSRGYSLE